MAHHTDPLACNACLVCTFEFYRSTHDPALSSNGGLTRPELIRDFETSLTLMQMIASDLLRKFLIEVREKELWELF